MMGFNPQERWIDGHGAIAFTCALWAGVIAASPAMAQTFDVPDGFAREIVRESTTDGSVAVLRIRPDDGAFSNLSTIEMRPITDEIADPDEWLRERVTADFEFSDSAPEGMFDSPDSPLSDPAFNDMRDTGSTFV